MATDEAGRMTVFVMSIVTLSIIELYYTMLLLFEQIKRFPGKFLRYQQKRERAIVLLSIINWDAVDRQGNTEILRR
jgi:hypothetical protein